MRVPLRLLLPLSLAACNPAQSPHAAASPEAPLEPTPPAALTAPVAPRPLLTDVADRLPDVAERAVASVVNISTTRAVQLPQSPMLQDPFFRYFHGRQQAPREQLQRSLGSGVIVERSGVVLTNNHVIDGADEIEVTLSDERRFKAELVGADPSSDLAVLRLVDAPDDLKALEFGDSEALRLGEVVLAVGNPFGVGQTVTMGIVSAKGRAEVGIVDYEDFIQTDAAINPGNSGGALVDLNGRLVGINTAILSRSGGYQGVGFAIPAKMVRHIMDQLLSDGQVHRGWLGVVIQDVDDELKQALAIDADGVLVADVLPEGPAAALGLKRGDVVLSLDGEAVNSVTALRNAVADAGAGSQVRLEVLREGERLKLEGALGEREADGVAAADAASRTATTQGAGLGLRALSLEQRQQLALPERFGGVLIDEVQPDGPAAKAGLQRGDVLLEVNRQPVRSPAEASEAWLSADGRVLMLIWRGGSTRYVALAK